MCMYSLSIQELDTVEPVLKDHSHWPKNMVSEDRWSLVTGSFTLKYDFLPQTGLSRQVVSHGSGLSGQVSGYCEIN